MQKEFIREIRFAYNHLYEWAVLRKSPLVSLFDLNKNEDISNALGNILKGAIEAVKPKGEINLQQKSWRIYQLLYARYIEQLSQPEAAHDLGLSLRHLRREETMALETVGLYLWERHNVADKWQHAPPFVSQPTNNLPAEATPPDSSSELKWLQQSIPFESVKIQDLLHEILVLDDIAIRKQMIQVEFNLPESLPPVTTRRTTLRQALLTIVNTAINAIPKGTLEFNAEVQLSELLLIVEGFGISEINPPAFSDEGTITILNQLIDLSGGRLTINSTGRDGSGFVATISLPVKDVIKVMVVDDNRDILQFVARCLTGTRYLIIPVSEPEKAVEAALTNLPQVIILDVMLPRIDGWELLGSFKNHPSLKNIPIVVFSILNQEQMAKDLGAMDFLKKPVSRDDLLAFLEQNSHYFLIQ